MTALICAPSSSFETRSETAIGIGSGVFRLIYVSEGTWKAHTVYTNLEDLKGFPEQLGPLRDDQPNHGKWPEKRHREINFIDSEPAVVIVGAGQSGLEVAARLKFLNVPTLVVERELRENHKIYMSGLKRNGEMRKDSTQRNLFLNERTGVCGHGYAMTWYQYKNRWDFENIIAVEKNSINRSSNP